MLSKSFNKEFFESIYRLNECGSSGCGSESEPSCGRSGCGLKESLQRMNECGNFVGRCGAINSNVNSDSHSHSNGRGHTFKVGDEVTIVTYDGEFVDGEIVGPAN